MAETLNYLDVVIPASGEVSVGITGQFLAPVSATSSNFQMQIGDDGTWVDFDAGVQYQLPENRQFPTVRFRDRSGSANTVGLYYGRGDFRDNRVSINGSVTTTLADAITTQADDSINSATATLLLAPNAGRRDAIIQNLDGAAELRVGDSNVSATRGVKVSPGGTLILSTRAAIYAYQNSGAAIDVSATELEIS